MLYKTWLKKKIKAYEKDYDELFEEIHTTPTQELKQSLKNLIATYKKALSDFGFASGDKVTITCDGKYLNQEGVIEKRLDNSTYSVKMPNGHLLVTSVSQMESK